MAGGKLQLVDGRFKFSATRHLPPATCKLRPGNVTRHTSFLNGSVVKFYAGLHSKPYFKHWSKTPIFIGLLDPDGQVSTVKFSESRRS